MAHTVVTAAPSSRLLSIATVKEEVRGASSRTDPQILRWIDIASSAVATYCGRKFQRERLLQTEGLRHAGAILLDRYPVTGPVLVTMDGEARDPSTFVVDPETGELWAVVDGVRRPWLGRAATVDYWAGWVLPSFPAEQIADATPDQLLPAAVEEACLVLLQARTFTSGASGRDPMLRSDQSVDMGGSSWVASADMDAMPPQATALLEPFRVGPSV